MFALPLDVAAPIGALPGTKQFVPHAAAWELHSIMQVVTAELCAFAVLPKASAAQTAAKHSTRANNCRMTASRFFHEAPP
jgi:hypothetical protein